MKRHHSYRALPGAPRRRRASVRASLVAAMLLFGLSACSPDPETGNAANLSAQANEVFPADAEGSTPPPPKAAAPEAPLVLAGNGLRLVESGGSEGRLLVFEAPMTETIEALTRALGGPPSERGTNEECGGGSQVYAEWKGKIRAWFAEGQFVGWDSEGDLKTADGLAVGSPRTSIRNFQVEQSSLGTEFADGSGLSGLLDSKSPQAKVKGLWAGSTCVFR